MFNNQFLHSNGSDKKSGFRDEKAFPYPACFIEFIIEQSDNRALGIIDYILIVRFRLGVRSERFERLDTFDFSDSFKASIQMMAATTASGLTFTTFQEVTTEFDEDHDNVEMPYIDYHTRYRSSIAYQRRSDVITLPVEPIIIEL